MSKTMLQFALACTLAIPSIDASHHVSSSILSLLFA